MTLRKAVKELDGFVEGTGTAGEFQKIGFYQRETGEARGGLWRGTSDCGIKAIVTTQEGGNADLTYFPVEPITARGVQSTVNGRERICWPWPHMHASVDRAERYGSHRCGNEYAGPEHRIDVDQRQSAQVDAHS